MKAKKIFSLLEKEYPGAKISLNFSNPLELLVATILSAQCTDQRVNLVTGSLFKKYRKTNDYAEANISRLENEMRSVNFYKNKAKNIKKCCQILSRDFSGQIPGTLEELTKLPGIGRKTANVILGNTFGVPGIVVDTHVKRVTNRLGLTDQSDPVKIEFDLMGLLNKNNWSRFSTLMITHGRKICSSRKPLCAQCILSSYCDSYHS